MRFEVLMALKIFFWVVILCGLIPFWRNSPEEGDSMFLQNVGIYVLVHIVS
jgi:ABC-type amino acid transport system permease subunit